MIIKKHLLRRIEQKESFIFNPHQKALLVAISDIHWGAKGFARSHFENTIHWAVDRGCYFLGIGDYLNFASLTQRAIMSMLRDETKEDIDKKVRADADDLLKVLAPTKGRWIGMVEGNHTWSFDDHTNIEQYLCGHLGADYLGTSGLIRLQFEDAPGKRSDTEIIVFAHHGKTSSAKTVGGHLNAPENVLKWLFVDLCLMGHDHSKVPGPSDMVYITPDNKLVHKTRIAARTGGYLKGYEGKPPQKLTEPASHSAGNYVEEGLMPPSSIGSLCFSLGYEKIDGSRYYRPVIHGSF